MCRLSSLSLQGTRFEETESEGITGHGRGLGLGALRGVRVLAWATAQARRWGAQACRDRKLGNLFWGNILLGFTISAANKVHRSASDDERQRDPSVFLVCLLLNCPQIFEVLVLFKDGLRSRLNLIDLLRTQIFPCRRWPSTRHVVVVVASQWDAERDASPCGGQHLGACCHLSFCDRLLSV